MSLKYVVRAAEKTYKQATYIINKGYEWRRTAEVEELDKEWKRFNEMWHRFSTLNQDQNLVEELDAPPAANDEDEDWIQW